MATLDDFGQIALERYTSVVDQHNVLVSKTKAVESREKFQETFMDSADELAEYNEKIEKLKSALETVLGQRLVAAIPLVEPAYQAALSGVGVDPEQIKELKKQITASAKYLTSIYGDDVLEGTPKPENVRTGSGTSSGTTGSRRIRGFLVYIDGVLAGAKNSDGVFKSTFSAASKELGVENVDLQKAFFEAAGTENLKAEDFPAVVDFDFAGKTIRAVKDDSSEDSE